MKHIKPKKIFESITDDLDLPNNIKQDIRDICLEAEDNGFRINCESGITNYDSSIDRICKIKKFTCIYFRKKKYNHFFKYKEIQDVMERIRDYLKSEGYNSWFLLTEGDSWNELAINNRNNNLAEIVIIIEI